VLRSGWVIDRVDIHWHIRRANGARDVDMNERMTKIGDVHFTREMLQMPIQLNDGDCLKYWFTYIIKAQESLIQIQCDTDKFLSCSKTELEPQPHSLIQSQVREQSQSNYGSRQIHQLPQQELPQLQSTQTTRSDLPQSQLQSQVHEQSQSNYGSRQNPQQQIVLQLARQELPQTQTTRSDQLLQCPAINFEHQVILLSSTSNLYKIQFRALTDMKVQLVDVHWHIQRASAGDLSMNERMTSVGSNTFERNLSTLPIQLNDGDCIKYWFTYCIKTDMALNGRIDCDTSTFDKCIASQQTQQPQPQQQQQLQLETPTPIPHRLLVQSSYQSQEQLPQVNTLQGQQQQQYQTDSIPIHPRSLIVN